MVSDHYWANDGERFHHARPGEGAHRKADELAASRSTVSRFLDVVAGRHTEESAAIVSSSSCS